MTDSVVGGGDSDEVGEPSEQASQSAPGQQHSSQAVSKIVKTASWEEKIVFPEGLRSGDKEAIFRQLQRCPADQRQAVIDEMAARRERIKSPAAYVRKLVECALVNEFIPEAGITLAEARERRKNDFQSPLPTRRPAPSESVRAEIERLTAEMVAAQRAGDFKRYSRLGARVGLLTCVPYRINKQEITFALRV